MIDWRDLFVPGTTVAEVVVRATVMYLFLFLALRFLLKREGGAVNIADLLVVVAIVDGAQPAFNGEADSITESVLFVLTVIAWSYALNWLSYRVPALRYLTSAPPLLLVRDGRMDRANMRRALMSREELLQLLREDGYDDVADVKAMRLEGNGNVSIVGRD